MDIEIDSSSAAPSYKDGTPWVERYRPKTLEDVSHQTEVVNTLQNAVRTGRLPHLLLYGPPGSGKTSVALALCKELWHPSQLKRRVLELNASDERGISVVREKIKQFASLSVGGSSSGSGDSSNKKQNSASNFFGKQDKENSANGRQEANMDIGDEKKYPNPPFKIIILDEADTERLTSIAQAEGISSEQLNSQQMDAILDISGGDMRRAVTSLQSVQALLVGDTTTVVDEATLSELSGQPPNHVVEKLYQALLPMKFDVMKQAVKEVVADGYSVQMLLGKLLEKLTLSSETEGDLDELGRARLSIRIAEAEDRMNDGADEELQLLTVCGLALECLQAAKRSNAMKQ
ncbi:MAG: hypothetical protein SGARI_004413 [Bacillariaceae sp.]